MLYTLPPSSRLSLIITNFSSIVNLDLPIENATFNINKFLIFNLSTLKGAYQFLPTLFDKEPLNYLGKRC